jgi:YVTN family beta-propeller protein
MATEAAADKAGPAAFRVLGPLEVLRSGQAVPLGGPRQRAVLALLLLQANQLVSVDRLVEDVWEGHAPEAAITTLQTYVFHLRRALEPGRPRGAAGEVLATRDRGYLLHVSRDRLDAAVFEDGVAAGLAALEAGRHAEAGERLGRALDLWRGAVLADLGDYAFIKTEAARLEELRLAALEARIRADLALGRHHMLTAELDRLVREHPLRESLHAERMLALYRCGRQADALAAYLLIRDVLADELGIDPGEQLRRLHERILAQDPALDWPQATQALIPAEAARAVAAEPGSPGPGGPARRFLIARNGPAAGPSGARRLLVLGLVLAVAAVASAVVVARPWAHEQASLPANSIGLIDSGGGQVSSPVPLGSPDGLAYSGGIVWAVSSTENTLSRVDPVTHAVVQQIPVGSAPTAVTVTGADVWVANSGDGTVSRINTAANAVVQQITVGNVPVAIASGPSGVWVANQGDDTVARIDPVTGAVTMTVSVGLAPDAIAVGPNAVWVANGEDGTVNRIDPATGAVSGPDHVGAGPDGIAITQTAVWVANSLDLTVSKIDPATGRVTATIGVGDGPRAIVAGQGGIWVSDEFDATLARIDPQTGQVVRKIFLGSSPQGLAIAGSDVWVAARAFAAASHRGGTLTVVTKLLPATDPVVAYGASDLPALSVVYEGLVALRRSGGTQGYTLVPDLATKLPLPTDGGRTYTFALRPGIEYSSGAPVRASDFRRGIQRQLAMGANPAYYTGIFGAPQCQAQPRQCQLSAGIAADDAAGTVTFHLTQADPDFLYKLALLLAVPAPPGAPSRVIDRAPFLPGTGPYMIAQDRPGASFTLVRNPHFRQWSYAAQPAGYPDIIRFDDVADPGTQLSAVMAGRADLVDLLTNSQPSRDLGLRYPTRLHSSLRTGTTYVFLNTRQPPFSNVTARQAVSYAIDRAHIVSLFGLAPDEAAVTCQILPVDFPGHQPYCPYTTGSGDGAWHGPDAQTALRLVRASHTTNVPVTVWGYFGDGGVGAYLVRLLTGLGYRATLHAVSVVDYYTAIFDPARKVQIGLANFGSDFPSPSTFFVSGLSCLSASQSPANNNNSAGYCNPGVDELASEAQAAELVDPADARALWARVDRTTTDQAPWAPVFNSSWQVFVSARVGNCQVSTSYGPLLDQMWVR